METNTTVENLRAEHARLDAFSGIFREAVNFLSVYQKLTSAMLNSEQTQ